MSSVAVVSPIVAVLLGAVPMFWDVAVGTPLSSGVVGGVVVAFLGWLQPLTQRSEIEYGRSCPRVRVWTVFWNRTRSHGPNNR